MTDVSKWKSEETELIVHEEASEDDGDSSLTDSSDTEKDNKLDLQANHKTNLNKLSPKIDVRKMWNNLLTWHIII